MKAAAKVVRSLKQSNETVEQRAAELYHQYCLRQGFSVHEEVNRWERLSENILDLSGMHGPLGRVNVRTGLVNGERIHVETITERVARQGHG